MKNVAQRVFILGIDGAGNAIRDAYTPHIDALLKESMYTYEGMTSIPTISGECWGSLFHGVGPEKHGLTNERADTELYDEQSAYPSFMKVIRVSDPSCKLASFSAWDPINRGIIEGSSNCHLETAGDEVLVERIVDYIKNNDAKVVFVQLDAVDGAGHTYGYRTPKYYEQITEVDAWVGKMIAAIKDADYYDESAIIVCADHGGGGGHFYSHGSDHYLDTTIFWSYKGAGMTQGQVIKNQVHIKDTAAVVLDALGVSLPEAWDCKVPEDIANLK
ncbi:MAG: alkaline phosphatase family protein [Cellulosilyticaceae bacterium]